MFQKTHHINLSISWKVLHAQSKKQAVTTIEISKDRAFQKILYKKSGKLHSPFTLQDLSLAPRTRYYIQITVAGKKQKEDEKEESASAMTWFETGKRNELWKARWIGPDDQSRPPVLFTSFPVKEKEKIEKARIYLCGVGLFEARLNGKKIGQDRLSPFYNDYRHGLQICTYDIKDLLKPGKDNSLEIELADGWYKGRLGYEGHSKVFGEHYACIVEVHIDYEDGSSELICSDESWKSRPSQRIFSDMYDGEIIDRTLTVRPEEIASVEFVDIPYPLVDRFSPGLVEKEILPVKEIIHTPKGETVLDFGQNFSGYVRFLADFPAGTRIRFNHGEILQDGNFYHDNYRSAKTEFTYISNGKKERVSPKFFTTGFRYVLVEGFPQGSILNREDFKGIALYSDLKQTGMLETGHEKINKLISNALWGLKSNFMDMPTDCPQRDERLGWSGDAQVFAPTASFFMDTKAFYRKYLWDLRNDQKTRNGAVAAYLPDFGSAAFENAAGAAIWADAATFIPTTLYESFADLGLLKEHYPLMKDWVDYMAREDEQSDGGPHYLYDHFTFGDWVAMDGITDQSFKGATEDKYLGSIYFYASTKKLARAAGILGYQEDQQYYESLAEKIREALLNEYFTPSGRLAITTQAGYVTALKHGVYRDREVLVQGLKNKLKQDANLIQCGFAGGPLMAEVLAENGLDDLALHLLLQEKFPSWLYCINLGATTIWERWNSVLEDGSISGTGMNSLNHYAYGSIINYIVRHLAGLIPLEPGYRKVLLKPFITPHLKHIDLNYDSNAGKYVFN